MPVEIRMPRLVDSMTHGAVVAWRKAEGDAVRAGEAVAEIEADKTTVDLESPADGRLARIAVPAGGEKVAVGELLAVLEALDAAAAAPAPTPAAARPANGSAHAHAQPEPESAPAPAPAPTPAAAAGEGHAATPLALSLARQAGLDLARLRPAGGGAVRSTDVLSALGLEAAPRHPATSAAPASSTDEPAGAPPYDEVPHSRLRQVVAQRLGESKRNVPHFYLEVSCQVDALLRMRSELLAGRADGLKLSINDFVLRAAALALRRVPEANAAWTDSAARRYRAVDLAFAAATDAGLVAPVIRRADRKGLAEIAADVRDLSARARAGKLRPEELQGGTFTVSNLGMYGIDAMYAIVNPPQGGILGVGTAAPRPVVRDGSVAVATVMTLTLSADHRLLDGHVAARLLAEVRSLLERPIDMAL